jgi:cell wall-associated NlpC family hydrolase
MNLPLDIALFMEVFDHLCIHGTTYKLGAKAPSLSCDTSLVSAIDCSGFVRYLLARASRQGLVIPDGSVNQHQWCREQGFPKVAYGGPSIATSKRLYLAFIEPVYEVRPGHVWFVYQGHTMESYGGQGVGSRAWNTPVLVRRVAGCYQLWKEDT